MRKPLFLCDVFVIARAFNWAFLWAALSIEPFRRNSPAQHNPS